MGFQRPYFHPSGESDVMVSLWLLISRCPVRISLQARTRGRPALLNPGSTGKQSDVTVLRLDEAGQFQKNGATLELGAENLPFGIAIKIWLKAMTSARTTGGVGMAGRQFDQTRRTTAVGICTRGAQDWNRSSRQSAVLRCQFSAKASCTGGTVAASAEIGLG
jgi:hypothetical protein